MRTVTEAPVETLAIPRPYAQFTTNYLASLEVTNTADADRWVFLFDGEDESGDLISVPLHVPKGETATFVPATAIPFKTGLFIASSSASDKYTASTTADLWLAANVKAVALA